MRAKPPVFVLLGRAAAGKTETSPIVSRLTGLPVIELGQFIRKKAAQGDLLADHIVVGYMSHGHYFPAEWSFSFLEKAIAEHPQRFTKGFVIDGFPRDLHDLPLFEEWIHKQGFRVGGCLELKIPFQVSNRRQSQRKGRPESLAAQQSRQAEFKKKEQAVTAAFRRVGLLQTISMTVGGRKRRIPELRKPFELNKSRFLRKKGRLIAKRLIQLRKTTPR